MELGALIVGIAFIVGGLRCCKEAMDSFRDPAKHPSDPAGRIIILVCGIVITAIGVFGIIGLAGGVHHK